MFRVDNTYFHRIETLINLLKALRSVAGILVLYMLFLPGAQASSAHTPRPVPAVIKWHSQPQVVPDPENQVKAVFLFNFTQFIEWPATAFPNENAPMILGILGRDPFGDYIDQTIRNERAGTHPIIVRRFNRVSDVDACHILFISTKNEAEMNAILSTLKGKSILTVGDSEDFMKEGGMIGFYTEGKKLRFMVNPGRADAERLRISSKLLRVATPYRGK